MKTYLAFPEDFNNMEPGFPIVHEALGEGTFVRRDRDANGRPVYYFRFSGVDHPLYGTNIGKHVYINDINDDNELRPNRPYRERNEDSNFVEDDTTIPVHNMEAAIHPEERFVKDDRDFDNNDFKRYDEGKSDSSKLMSFEDMFDSLFKSHKKNDGELTKDVWERNYDTSQLMLAQLRVIETDLQEYSNDMATGARMFDKSSSLDPERDMADWGGRFYDYRDRLEDIRKKLKEVAVS